MVGASSASKQTPKRGSSVQGSQKETPIDLTSSPLKASSKRQRSVSVSGTPTKSSPSRKKAKATDAPPEEKRLRRFRSQPPQAFDTIYQRAVSQRFFVLNRKRTGTEDCPGEDVELAGSTGNVYHVLVGQVPSCNCPHALKGNQCKHVLYVMAKVLRAPFDLIYQTGLLSSELRNIFAKAPPIEDPNSVEKSKNRKPVEGDCPICYEDLNAIDKETVVWCQAACGQNIHKTCFETWSKARRSSGPVTCPLCRSVWAGESVDVSRLTRNEIGEDGYINVADQLGISGVRGKIHIVLVYSKTGADDGLDSSSYSRWPD
ncbi:hypothetical protein Golomagni_06066 [Golovinomyces magnicellulatus]|nr:hypothetical protein Golomagni_06066 [Golovinomyces magnicellulatus]